MADDKARKIAEEAFNRLSAELEAGRSETLKHYLASMARFHHYSWNNALLIHSQCPDATHVAGFHAWHEHGRYVKKGEKGIMILAPVPLKEKDDPTADRSDKESTRERVGFRTAYVWDVSQTEGKPLPEFAKTTGDPKDFGQKLKAIAETKGISVQYDPNIGSAMGTSSGGHIRIKPGLDPAEEFTTLVHELAHEILHHPKGGPVPPEKVVETQAEAVAYVVSHGIGLENNHSAADYIALYNGDKKTLAQSLAVIQSTAARILDELLPRERDHQNPPSERAEAVSPSSRVAAESDLAKGPASVAEATTPMPEEPPVFER